MSTSVAITESHTCLLGELRPVTAIAIAVHASVDYISGTKYPRSSAAPPGLEPGTLELTALCSAN